MKKIKTEKAIFAAGCFWHVQKTFDNTPGVVATVVGYIGGLGTPDYESAEEKGFAEAIEIEFNPEEISYSELLDVFWRDHDPTSLNRQRADVGRRYRSAVFYHGDRQKRLAVKSMKELQKKLDRPIVTEIVPAGTFLRAEEYHQKHY